MIRSQIIIDFYKANSAILAKSQMLEDALTKALMEHGVKLDMSKFYQFEPEGVSATIVSPELQLSVHTWPEHGSCTIDMFSQLGHEFTTTIAEEVKNFLEAQEYDIKVLNRK